MGKENTVNGKKKDVSSGCIKITKEPWIVHRTTKNGGVASKYRFPSERECQNNRQRECKRQAVSRKMFTGLQEHGNYKLPKQANSNDQLKALCEEATWHVEEDGTIYKKNKIFATENGVLNAKFEEHGVASSIHDLPGDKDYCNCNNHTGAEDGVFASRIISSTEKSREGYDVNLSLSLSLPKSINQSYLKIYYRVRN